MCSELGVGVAALVQLAWRLEHERKEMSMFSESPLVKVRSWRGVLAVLVVLTWARVWVGPLPVVESARAQIPDVRGSQWTALLEEARRTNQLLDEIKQVLRTQTLNVHIRGADNSTADNGRGAPGAHP
ncbi:MAG: hypothetical protein KJ749_13335 [Planctomycetes bacterium]|nr:hypothetical protein [Planctomycetota bacterium]